jgi:hypothetical protein
MRRIRPVLRGLFTAGFFLGLTSLPGCSSSGETGDASAPKVSKRDEAGKKFPFADDPAPKGAAASKKTPSR